MNKVQITYFAAILTAIIIFSFSISTLFEEPSVTGNVPGPKIHPNDKISQKLADKLNEQEWVNVIILLSDDGITKGNPNSIKEKQDKVLDKFKDKDIDKIVKTTDFELKYKYSTINAIAGNITRAGILKIQDDVNVKELALARKVSSMLTNSVPLINASYAWGLKIGGENITGTAQSICIIDTGVDYTHESLGSCSLTNVSENKCKVISGYDFVNTDTNPIDDNNHGTHVAGIAAANGNIIGVAKNAGIVAIKALNSAGSGSDADVIAGIDWCINNATKFNISIVSMSLGDEENHTSSTCPTTMDVAAQTAIDAGISILAASGNEYKNTGINYPACSPYIISVGASDDDDNMVSFTNTHSLLDIVAPGLNIASAKRGGGTLTLMGTSMATPHAAGLAALIYHKEKLLNNRSATHDEIKELLKRSDVNISDSGLTFPRIDTVNAIKGVLKINQTDNSAFGNDVNVKFLASTNVENMSMAFIFDNNFVSLNASRYSNYNKSANITFYNLTFSKTPVILRNNEICSDCDIFSYSSGTLSFNVTHFTNYTAGINSKLEIFDQTDSKGGSVNAIINNQVYFYANYTNYTSNEEISSANCSINFTDMYKNMTYNSSIKLYKFNRSFSSADTYTYNISCSHYWFEALNLSENIVVITSCLDQTADTNITINAGATVNCTGETITLKNQSINVYGNLILNSSYLFMETTNNAYGNISLFNQSNLTIVNSTINASVNLIAVIAYNSSKAELDDADLFNVDLILEGNSNNKIFNSNVNRTYFIENSYTEIKNSNITGIRQLGGGSAVLNFTLNSTITAITEIINNSTIYGYVALPSSVSTYTTINVKRYYPVEVNFTNSKPAINKLVNVTNLTNQAAVWSGNTDSDGLLTINITFTEANKMYNYSVTINPVKNISLLTDTPIVFTLNDTTVPAISSVASSGVTSSSATITWTTDDYSNTSVNYGTGASLGLISQTDDYVISHSRTLASNLSASTKYYYNVTSCSSGGCNTSGGHSFTTTSTGGAGTGGGSGGGGGGGGGAGITPPCEPSWFCDLWSKCVNGYQSRICQDIYGCEEIRTETQECIIKIEEEKKPVVETPKAVIPIPVIAPKQNIALKLLKQYYLFIIAGMLALILISLTIRRVVFRKKTPPKLGVISNVQSRLIITPQQHEQAIKQYRSAFDKFLTMNETGRNQYKPKLDKLKRKLI